MAPDTAPEFQENAAPKAATALSIILIISFALYAVAYSRQKEIALESKNLENFLTARKSVGWVNIGWSFYASAVGSWVITAPAEFGFFGGILPIIAYAFAAAIPIWMITVFGGMIHKIYPNVLSLSDFAAWRFGKKTQVLVVAISLFNMSVAATAEFTTLSSLYSDFVGLKDYTFTVVILVAVVTLSYTVYGGLKASIVTDRAQAAVSLFLVQIVAIYVAADFKNLSDVTDDSFGNDTAIGNETVENVVNSGFNPEGYAAVFTLPLSLATATIFSEALWQRTWAAEDDAVLRKGALFGSILIFIVVGTFGGLGVIVSWANLVDDLELETFNSNLFAFQAFSNESGELIVSSGIGVLVLLLGVAMAEGAIDSLQNGVGASVNGALGRYVVEKYEMTQSQSLNFGRVVLVLLNIPYVIIGLQKYSILSLFLIANMICVCAFIPIVIGFFPNSPAHPYLRDFVPPLSFFLTLFGTMIFAGAYYPDGETFADGVAFAFWNNIFYGYEYFLAALLLSCFFTASILLGVKVFLGPDLVKGNMYDFEEYTGLTYHPGKADPAEVLHNLNSSEVDGKESL